MAPFLSFAPFCFEEKEEKGREENQAPKAVSIVSGEMMVKKEEKKKPKKQKTSRIFVRAPCLYLFLLLLLSPVCRCEQEEKGEKCEDERSWNNEFIAECHPAMAISTIRHCRLPLKGRASKPPLPHFLLI